MGKRHGPQQGDAAPWNAPPEPRAEEDTRLQGQSRGTWAECAPAGCPPILPMNVHSSGGEGTAQGGRSHGSPPNSGNPVLNAAEYRNGGQAPRRAVGPGQQRISASERHCHALGRKRMDGSERGTLLKNVSRGLMDSGYRPGVRCSGGAFQKHIFRKTVKKTAWVEAKVSGKANSPAAADEQGLRFSD